MTPRWCISCQSIRNTYRLDCDLCLSPSDSDWRADHKRRLAHYMAIRLQMEFSSHGAFQCEIEGLVLSKYFTKKTL